MAFFHQFGSNYGSIISRNTLKINLWLFGVCSGAMKRSHSQLSQNIQRWCFWGSYEIENIHRARFLQFNMGACTGEKDWYLYIYVALVTYFGGLIILIPCRFLWYCFHKPDRYGLVSRRVLFFLFSFFLLHVNDYSSGSRRARNLLSPFTWFGKIRLRNMATLQISSSWAPTKDLAPTKFLDALLAWESFQVITFLSAGMLSIFNKRAR